MTPRSDANRAADDSVAPPRESGPLTVEIIDSVQGVVGLGPDYARLQQATHNTLPFALHEWHVVWCRRLLNLNLGRRIEDEICFHVVRNQGRECVAIVPLIRTRRAVGLLTVTTLALLGADPGLTEIRTPLIEPGYAASVARVVREHISRTQSFDWIHWAGIGVAFGEALSLGGALEWREPLRDFVLDLPPSFAELRANLKRNVRESIRHSYNSLKREGIEFQFRVAERPAEVEAALERFFELHALRAAMTGTVRHRNYFESQIARGFLTEVCAELARAGLVRVFELVIGAEVVAARIGFVVGGSLFLYYSGFDPAFARFGVMTTTLTEAIKYAIGERLTSVNLSTGSDTSKERWSPREVLYRQAVQVSPAVRSRLAWAQYRRATEADSQTFYARLVRGARRDWR